MQTIYTLNDFWSERSFFLRATRELLDPKTEVFSGYPANCSTWLTIYHHRKSQRWTLEWYERADCRRPQKLSGNAVCLMRAVTDKGAVAAEWEDVRSWLRSMAFFEA